MIICLDTEATSLSELEASPLENQPRIIEFTGAKLNPETLEEVDRLSFLCNPTIKIPEEAVKITGITDEMVKDAKPFISHYKKLCEFFSGTSTMVAHNLAYDKAVIGYELQRIDRLCAFPWPWLHICTVEASLSVKGHCMKLGDLHELATGQAHKDAHRSGTDVDALVRVFRWLRAEGMA